ncbi:MAG: molybdopterin cofactor-binding domain-containing protein, partial [Chloroflexota bacterium]
PIARVDALAKATGAHTYPSDVVRQGMLWVQVLRAPHPHAHIRAIDAAAAQTLPGVVCILTAKDVPGENRFGLLVRDQPVLCDQVVRYQGDALAIVAAETDEIARRARELIRVEYEPLPLVTDPEQALWPDAPRLHPQGNLCAELQLGRGDIVAGFAAADYVFEREYRTGRQEHAFLEPEAGAAYYDDEGALTLCVGGQNPFNDRQQVANALGVPEDHIRVLNPMMGGAFGGKEDISVQIYLALVTYHTKRPCRLRLDREESLRVGVKRHPFQVRYKTGVRQDGAVTACEVTILADAGAYTTLSPAVLALAANHCCGPYNFPHTKITARAVFTNNSNASAFRGFGNPQVVVGLEQQMDMMGRAVGLDPVAFRRRNAIRQGQPAGAGFTVTGTVTLPRVLDSVQQSELWQRREQFKQTASPWKKRGLGLAAIWQPFGLGAGIEPGAHTRIELQPNGRYLVHLSSPDLGGGSVTACLQLAAHELHSAVEDFDVVMGDSRSPNAGSSNASRTTFVVGAAVMEAAARLREAILAAARRLNLGGEPQLQGSQIQAGDRAVPLAELAAELGPLAAAGFFKPARPEPFSFGMPYAFGFSAQLALVEVDTLTGEIEVLKLENHLDVGRAINPQGVEGQSEGGMAQGLGYALYEDTLMQDGRVQNERLSTYVIPSIRDVPAEVKTILIQEPEPLSPHGGRGVGEIGLSATAGAIGNALFDALGVRFERLPVTPEMVLDALEQKGA